jgi:hypothetical protein
MNFTGVDLHTKIITVCIVNENLRSSSSGFRAKLMSCRPFSLSLVTSSFAVDSLVMAQSARNHSVWPAALGTARASQPVAEACPHAHEGQGTNEMVETDVAIMRLQNGSRWQ